jgi:hypothetical protein
MELREIETFGEPGAVVYLADCPVVLGSLRCGYP